MGNSNSFQRIQAILLAAFLSASFLNQTASADSIVSQANDFSAISQTPPEIAWGSKLQNPKAIILCIHGLGLHKATYDQFAKEMYKDNVEVHALDIRGFGDWYLNGKDKLDLDDSMNDIKQVLTRLHSLKPGVPVFLLGESMGGAIALQAAAAYPDLVQGLISSVPSGDRWGGLAEDLKLGSHVIFGGFNKRYNVGKHVVTHATSKPDLQSKWDSDPACRADFSPAELLKFQNFMEKNNSAAGSIKTLPVLVVQGAQDKLVRPGGTWSVWEHLSTPNRQVVVSKTAEHLIFEFGQFSPADIAFVSNWLSKQLAPKSASTTIDTTPEPIKKQTPSSSEILAGGPSVISSATPISTNPVAHPTGRADLSYWIELMREGKRFRCNNKTTFKSGDEIRIHVSSNIDGYAYILLKQGSSGSHAVLFPDAKTGQNNRVKAQVDYALPSATWLKFDEHPGREKVSLVFSPSQLDPNANRYLNNPNIVISSDRTGAKDLCPTRMQIAWDEPNPIIIPPDTEAVPVSNTSSVHVSNQEDKGGAIVVLDIDLDHQP